MDKKDKEILNIIQNEFPLVSKPYKEIGDILELPEEEVIKRVERLVDEGIIRQIGPVFSVPHLDYKSTLAVMEVPEKDLAEAVGILNSYKEITHNYGRKHKYNLWFTLICKSEDEINSIILELKRKTGIDKIFSLPQKKLFKIKVDFSF